jgi:hypothetical protein
MLDVTVIELTPGNGAYVAAISLCWIIVSNVDHPRIYSFTTSVTSPTSSGLCVLIATHKYRQSPRYQTQATLAGSNTSRRINMDILTILCDLINGVLDTLDSVGDRRQFPTLIMILSELIAAYSTNLSDYINLTPEELI